MRSSFEKQKHGTFLYGSVMTSGSQWMTSGRQKDYRKKRQRAFSKDTGSFGHTIPIPSPAAALAAAAKPLLPYLNFAPFAIQPVLFYYKIVKRYSHTLKNVGMFSSNYSPIRAN